MFNNKYLLFQLLTILLNWGICYGRVVYIQIHGEKPGIGCMDDASSQLKVMSSMDGLGDPQDGLVRIFFMNLTLFFFQFSFSFKRRKINIYINSLFFF